MGEMYQVSYLFNGIEHRIDVPAYSAADAAFRVGQHTDSSAEFLGAQLVSDLT